MANNTSTFSPEEQAKIEAAARNAFLDAQRKQPGYTGY